MNFYDLIRQLAIPVMGDLAGEIHAAIDRHEAEHRAATGSQEPAPSPAETAPAPVTPVTGEDPAHVVP